MPSEKTGQEMKQEGKNVSEENERKDLTPEELRDKLVKRLSGEKVTPDGKRFEASSVAFPPCSDVLLSQIKTTDINDEEKDHITKYFDEYFKFGKHQIFVDSLDIDKDLLKCLGGSWPPPWCLPPSCVTLNGDRGISKPEIESGISKAEVKRLFIADLVWLFYFERMGVIKILGVILDDFATKGKIPISNDNLTAIVLEAMVRQTKIGLSSTVRDRDSCYRRCLGWTSDVGRKLGVETEVNTAFNNLFHKFIQITLEFYKDKRLATAIKGITTPGKPSVATIVSIRDTIDVLKKAFGPFNYGRNNTNTLSGIVSVIAGMALIREVRTTLGIPDEYEQPHEYLTAAHDLLVMKRPITPSETNRYTTHRECANNARDILLDLQVLNHQDTKTGGELETWLALAESKIEGYRTAYRSLTGADLGISPERGMPKIEQQV